jgi:hypothetical protein
MTKKSLLIVIGLIAVALLMVLVAFYEESHYSAYLVGGAAFLGVVALLLTQPLKTEEDHAEEHRESIEAVKEDLSETYAEAVMWVAKDGNAWCAYSKGFVNLQESDNYAFDDTPEGAVSKLMLQLSKPINIDDDPTLKQALQIGLKLAEEAASVVRVLRDNGVETERMNSTFEELEVLIEMNKMYV